MTKFICYIQALAADKRAATAIEYGLIAAGIAVGISAVVFTFGDKLNTMFGNMSTKLSTRL